MWFSQNIDGFRQNDSQGFLELVQLYLINKTHYRNFPFLLYFFLPKLDIGFNGTKIILFYTFSDLF